MPSFVFAFLSDKQASKQAKALKEAAVIWLRNDEHKGIFCFFFSGKIHETTRNMQKGYEIYKTMI